MADRPTRRIELTAHRPVLAHYAGITPTLVIAGRGRPIPRGVSTWLVPADEARPGCRSSPAGWA